MIEFPTRIIWTSLEAKSIWEPRIEKISKAWAEIEKYKGNSLVNVHPDELTKLSREAIEKGFIVAPIKKTGPSGSYSIAEKPAGKDFSYRVAICKSLTDAKVIYDAMSNGNDKLLGWALGFPDCCINFFDLVWNTKQLKDTHFEMDNHDDCVGYGCNILLRSINLRMVSHLPCGFNCLASTGIAHKNKENAKRLGYEQEWDWLEEILSWPIEYSGLNGIAIIKTPCFEVSTPTDPSDEKQVIRLTPSIYYPLEGARGNDFPYRKEIPMQLDLYKINGFSSPEAQFEAHETVLNVAKMGLNKGSNSILDLGCGNGVFLQKVLDEFPHLKVFGVDLNQEALDVAQKILPRGMFTNVSLFDTDAYVYPGDDYSLTVFMPGRLIEHKREEFSRVISTFSRKVLLYAYSDWHRRFDSSIVKLAREAGFDNDNWKTVYVNDSKNVGACLLERR